MVFLEFRSKFTKFWGNSWSVYYRISNVVHGGCVDIFWNSPILSKTAKSIYFCHSLSFTFHSLVQLLLPTVKLNGVSQPISVDCKMVRGLNQAVFKT